MIHLLYVGTFRGRRLYETLEGFARFYHERSKDVAMRYTLVGTGLPEDCERLRRLSHALRIAHVVEFPGYIPHAELLPYFEMANIGVSYVPITSYYNHQPATKMFEYLFAGMPVVATGTAENRVIINPSNGVLIEDSADGFDSGSFQTIWQAAPVSV